MSKEAKGVSWKLVPTEPTPEIMAAAAMAVLAAAAPADIEMARKAARIVLERITAPMPGMSDALIAASIATMAPAYRAMIAEAQAVMQSDIEKTRAAAPELLEALERLHRWAQAASPACEFAGDHPIAVARAAITKATGETPC